YNFSQNKWHLSYQKDIAPGSFQHALYPVPEQNGALFQTTTYNPETQSQQWQLFWWQADAEPTPLLSSPQLLNIMRQSQRYSFIQNDHYFVGFEFIDRDGNNNLYFHWFDCQQGNCTVNEASGYPLWSPNKDHFLVWNITADKAELSFANPDGTPQQFIANAIALSWLNDNELAYVESIPQEDRSPRNVLKQYNLNQKAVTAELLDETDIYPLLPRRVRTHNLTISSITPIPNSDNWLLVVHTSTRRDDDLHLLQFNPITQDLQLLLVNNDSEPFTFRQPYWRDNGRYLIIPTLQNSILFGLTVFDYQQQTSRIIPAITPVYDWSADEEWILTQSGFSLQLESFTADITYPFLTEQHCQDAIWLK
ncbi:MAG TPA: hypothetical protein VLL52_01530, partial [Anaerolineae bacterium]|nr:hypothetical protein [Anaerolineae bacterium]